MVMNADLNGTMNIFLDIHEPSSGWCTAYGLLLCGKTLAMQSLSNKPIVCLVGNTRIQGCEDVR
jgi:hypothetical protein